MTRGKKIWIAVGGLVVVGALVAINLTYKREKKVTVQTELISSRRLESVVNASGKIKPKRQVNISASTIGKVTRLAVAEGDTVEEGQFLLQIDPEVFSAQVNALKARIEAAKSNLQEYEANLEQAKLELQRLTRLKEHDLSTEQDIDRARTSVEVETARTRSARREIDRLEAELKSASHQLEQVTFHAPLTGLVTALNIEEGENVVTGTMNNPGTVLLTIADLSEIEAEIDVDETDVVNIRSGQEAEVSIDAFPDDKFRGKVVKVGNSAVAPTAGISAADQTTNFRVTVALLEPVPGIKPSLSCSADITTAIRERTLTVPIQALTIRNLDELKKEEEEGSEEEKGGIQAASTEEAPSGGSVETKEAEPEADEGESEEEKELEGVFVVRDGRARFVPVETGISGEKYFEVLEGLQEGDEVITGSYQAIRDMKDDNAVEVDNSKKDRKDGEE